MSMSLNEILIGLQREGCYPSIYYRGDVWRAHVNACGNYWADNRSPYKAMAEAMRLWEAEGKPMDGMANLPEPP